MKDLNQTIEKILKQHTGGRPFFDALDFSIKGDVGIMDAFVQNKLKSMKSNHSYGL